ncbi:MAG: DUF3127 domain-containing protein [bacterium]
MRRETGLFKVAKEGCFCILKNIVFILYDVETMEFIGRILEVTKKETIGAQGVEKQSLVAEEQTDKQYKDSIMVDFFGEKCGLLSDVSVGDVVKILFNPRAKAYNGRRYNSLSGWKMEVVGKAGTAGAAKKAEKVPYDDNEDLPF